MQHRQPLPYPLNLFTGSIGKQFVVKRTPWGKIVTRYPDMSRIIASAGQRKCRNLFKEAVVYAKSIIADKVQTAAWQKRLNKTRRIYNAAISFYMKKEQLKAREEQLTARLIRQAVQGADVMEMGYLDPGCAGSFFLNNRRIRFAHLYSFKQQILWPGKQANLL